MTYRTLLGVRAAAAHTSQVCGAANWPQVAMVGSRNLGCAQQGGRPLAPYSLVRNNWNGRGTIRAPHCCSISVHNFPEAANAS